MSLELIEKTNQEDDKTMCMISEKIAYSKGKINRKEKLIFLWNETQDKKNQAKKALVVENYGQQGLQALTFAAQLHDIKNKDHETGNRKLGQKPQFKTQPWAFARQNTRVKSLQPSLQPRS